MAGKKERILLFYIQSKVNPVDEDLIARNTITIKVKVNLKNQAYDRIYFQPNWNWKRKWSS